MSFSDCQIIKCDDENLWLEERRKGIGASESPVLYGPDVTPWGSRFGLWAEKTGQVPPQPVVSDAAKWGRHLEEPIAEAYAEETGRKIIDPGRNTLLRSRTLPFLQATLDRVIEGDGRGLGVLEIKNVGAHKLDEWVEAPPLRYQVQLQHQLAVSGARWGALAALVGGQKLIRFDVERDEAFIEAHIALCAEFWSQVQSRTPPPVDGTEITKAVLARLHPRDNGEVVSLPARFVEVDVELQRIKEQAAKLEARERELRNELTAAIGPASFATLPNGVTYTCKVVEKKGHEVKPTSFRQLRRQAGK
jgi:putative phage-type endonuclease